MPDKNPFEIVTPQKSRKTSSRGVIVAILVTIFLGLGIFFGVLLVRQNQNIQEEAAASYCPAAQACPDPADRTMLKVCGDQTEADRTPDEMQCIAGRLGTTAVCGGRTYCCPSAGGGWTADLTKCPAAATATSTSRSTATSTATSQAQIQSLVTTATSSATAASTATATVTATATSTSRSTATSTATAAATNPPIPETGTGWPTFLGIGLGIVAIVGSLLLAL